MAEVPREEQGKRLLVRHRHNVARGARTVIRDPGAWHIRLCDQALSHTGPEALYPVRTLSPVEVERGLSRSPKNTGEQVREGARGSPYGVPVMGSRG
jgi:hypothetical protein